MDRAYRVILEPEPDGSAYNVRIPAFPKAHTWGRNRDEAMANAREIVQLELEDRHPNREPLPPSDLDTLVVDTVVVTLPEAS